MLNFGGGGVGSFCAGERAGGEMAGLGRFGQVRAGGFVLRRRVGCCAVLRPVARRGGSRRRGDAETLRGVEERDGRCACWASYSYWGWCVWARRGVNQSRGKR